jgi:hypothetical protein
MTDLDFRPLAHDALAQTGIGTHVRHPVHMGTLLEFTELILVLTLT